MLHPIAAHSFSDQCTLARRRNGRRVFAIDDSKINLQRSPDLDQKLETPEMPLGAQIGLMDLCCGEVGVRSIVSVSLAGASLGGTAS
jgi:hypothetical protein